MPRAPPNRAIALPPSPGSAWWVPSPHSLPTLPEFPRQPGPGDARGPSGGTLAKKFLPLSPAPRGRRRPLRRPAMLAAKRQDGGLFKGPPYPGYPFIMIPDLTSPYLPNGSLSPTARTVSATALPALPALLARPPAGPACPAPPPPRPSPLPSPLAARTLQTFSLPFVDWVCLCFAMFWLSLCLPRDSGRLFFPRQGSVGVVGCQSKLLVFLSPFFLFFFFFLLLSFLSFF